MSTVAMSYPSGYHPGVSDRRTSQLITKEVNKDKDYEEIEDDTDGSYHSDGDDLAEYWDPYLYQLQQKAPKPVKVICQTQVPGRPPFYGDEYHGAITRDEAARLLGRGNGRYLVRKGLSQSGTYSLSFVFNGNIRHYHLHFQNGEHFVGETTFEDIEDLVADGLITLFMEANNVEDYLKNAQRHSHKPSGLEPIPEQPKTPHSHTSSSDAPPPLPPRNRKLVNSTVVSASFDVPTGSEEEMRRRSASLGNAENYTNVIPKEKRDGSLYNYHYEKPHSFKINTYHHIVWCDLCHNFIWGLRSQGYTCSDCGYNCHRQCKDAAPSDCNPTRQQIKRVYGVDLTTVVKMYGAKVPLIVRDCIEEIEHRGLDSEGIYRIPGKSLEILQLKKKFDEEMHADLASYEDIHAVAGTLKLYFRELPIPLMTYDTFDLVLIAARCATDTETIDTIRVILGRLPPSHYNTLRYLMKHLNKVQELKSENRMDSKNLAVVFAPSIMRPPANQDQLSAMMKLPEQKKVTELLISRYYELFS